MELQLDDDGRIELPEGVREYLQVTGGDELHYQIHGNTVVIAPDPDDFPDYEGAGEPSVTFPDPDHGTVSDGSSGEAGPR